MPARVIRLEIGFAFVETESGERFGFTFDRIDGYAGEYSKELKRFGAKGLKVGSVVNIEIDEQRKVITQVQPILWEGR